MADSKLTALTELTTPIDADLIYTVANVSTTPVSRKTTIANFRKFKTTRITSGPYDILSTDQVIFVDTDGGAVTINLPAGVNGTNYRIINCGSSGNAVTITPNGADLLFGTNASDTLYDSEDENIVFETTEGWW